MRWRNPALFLWYDLGMNVFQIKLMMLRANERLVKEGLLPFEEYAKCYYQTLPKPYWGFNPEQLRKKVLK